MKTNRLNLLILILLVSFKAGAEGVNPFECLRDLLPATERGTYQSQRRQVEKPFVINDKYIVFPEISGRQLTGFYLYDQVHAYYYDAIEIKTERGVKRTPIADLKKGKYQSIYQMVVQPSGLETVTLYYMPGFDSKETNRAGPVVLGTVLPVIGALVSRPEQYDSVYQNPNSVPDRRLKEFITNAPKRGRSPASVAGFEDRDAKVERKIVSLIAQNKKDEKSVWRPLTEEINLRKAWAANHNLDDRTYKETQRALNGPCKNP